MSCKIALFTIPNSTNYTLEKKNNKSIKKTILLKKIMLTKYDKHTNQKVHVRAVLLGIAKLCHFNTSKNLLYYFTTLFYNKSFITCSIL